MMTSISTSSNIALRSLINDESSSSSFAPTRYGVEYGRTRPGDVRLPSIPEDKDESHDLVTGHFGSQYLEGMESILEGVAVASTAPRGLGESRDCAKKQPRLCPRRSCRDLKGLMTGQELRWLTGADANRCEDGPSVTRATMTRTRTTGRNGLKNRMEEYLQEGLARILVENTDDGHGTKRGKASPTLGTSRKQKKNTNENTNPAVSSGVPMVWVIQPFVQNGKTKFKFSTDFGACFVLEEKDSLEFVEIANRVSKKKTISSFCCNTFYQMYTTDSRESRVVDSDIVSSLIKKTKTTMASSQETNPQNDRKDESSYDRNRKTCTCDGKGNILVASIPPTTGSSNTEDLGRTKEGGTRFTRGPTKRLSRYLHRRRLKRLFRQQSGIALGNVNSESRRSWLVSLLPFHVVWKIITRRGTSI